ncbi:MULTISPECIES: IS3 family transposase [unclassified Thioalkalivibrio]|uniref:IS3 family transposase n=1 Tax=unclassified Thioalkalivibrio TaxID=2621013 RepID=UPI0003A8BD27|nr:MULTISPECIES: IS3 family transposase [unclassified Thioalkalivibrio]
MHRCITALKEKALVQRVCDLLETNRSSYYAAQTRGRRPRWPCALGQRVKEAFEQSEWTYGSRRVQAALRSDGVEVGRYRVRRLIREQGLRLVLQSRQPEPGLLVQVGAGGVTAGTMRWPNASS